MESRSKKRRWPVVVLVLGVLAAVGVPLYWATRTTRPIQLPGSLVSELESAQTRLRDTLTKREEGLAESREAAADGAKAHAAVIARLRTAETDLKNRLEAAGVRAASIDDGFGETAPVLGVAEAPDLPPDVLQWQLQKVRERIGDLIEGREELSLREAPDALAIEAEASWELDFLSGLAAQGGVPKKKLPSNEFMFLDKGKLSALKDRWQKRANQLETMTVGVPPDGVKAALDEAQGKLSRIAEAQGAAAPPDVVAIFREAGSKQAVLGASAWITERLAAKPAEISQRRAHLIEAALVRNPSNLGLLLSASPLNAKTASAAAAAHQQSLALDRARALRPLAVSDPNSYVELVKNRFADPLAAVEMEAALRLHWTELKTLTGEARERLLPEELADSFYDWLASRLGDAALVEVKAYMDEARQRLDEIRAAAGGTAPEFLGVDLKTVEAEADAIDREIAFRAGERPGAKRKARPDFDAPKDVVDLLERHARVSYAEVLATDAGKQQHWQTLAEYAVRVAPHSETSDRIWDLWKTGITAEVDLFVKDARQWNTWRDKFSRAGLAVGGDVPGFKQHLTKAQTAMEERAQRLRAALDVARANLPVDVIAGLIARIDEEHGPRPPPDGPPPIPVGPDGKPPRPAGPGGAVDGWTVSPFGDGLLASQRQQFLDALAQLEQFPKPPDKALTQPRPRLIVVENDPQRQVFLASKGGLEKPAPSDLEGFRPQGKVPTFHEIDTLKKFNLLPGGVALGQQAAVEGDWSDATLSFDPVEGRLLLTRPNGEYRSFPRADPALLKTCFLFARDNGRPEGQATDTVAVSIAGPRIFLHPALRDTQLGQDIIDADRLPWSLSSANLPNGAKNSFMEKMKGPLKAPQERAEEQPLVDRLIKRLAPLADIDASPGKYDEDRSKQLLERAAGIKGGEAELAAFLTYLGTGAPRGEAGYGDFLKARRKNLVGELRTQLKQEAEALLAKDPLKRKAETREAAGTSEAARNLSDGQLFKRYTEGLKTAINDTKAQGAADSAETAALSALWASWASVADDDGTVEAGPNHESIKEALAIRAETRKLFGLEFPERLELFDELAADALHSPDPERYVGWDEAAQLTLVRAAAPVVAGASLRAVSQETIDDLVGGQLSLITDRPSQWHVEGPHALGAEGVLRIRYVRRHFEERDDKLHVFEDGLQYPEAGQIATDLIPDIEKDFAPLKRVREGAAWIGLFRWAIAGKVKRLALEDLAAVEHRTVKTPDLLFRGSEKQIQALRDQFGLKPALSGLNEPIIPPGPQR